MKKFLLVFLLLFSFATLSAAIKGKSTGYQQAFDYCNDRGMHLGDESEYKSFGISSGAYWQRNGCLFSAGQKKEYCSTSGIGKAEFYCFE